MLIREFDFLDNAPVLFGQEPKCAFSQIFIIANLIVADSVVLIEIVYLPAIEIKIFIVL